MAQVKEKTSVITRERKGISPLVVQRDRLASTALVNQWIRSFRKWIGVSEQWKKEAHLIDRLVNMSIMGEETSRAQLVNLQSALRSFVSIEVKEMETDVLEMQQNIDLLRRCVINSEERVRITKTKIQQLSKTYGSLKHEILHELANAYPVTFH